MHADPAAYLFEAEDEEAQIHCWTILTDGHGVRIEGGPILYRADRGRIVVEDDGTATLRARPEELFLNAEVNEIVVRVEAEVEGYDVVAEPREVVFRRR